MDYYQELTKKNNQLEGLDDSERKILLKKEYVSRKFLRDTTTTIIAKHIYNVERKEGFQQEIECIQEFIKQVIHEDGEYHLKGTANLITITNQIKLSENLMKFSDEKRQNGTDTDAGIILPKEINSVIYGDAIENVLMDKQLANQTIQNIIKFICSRQMQLYKRRIFNITQFVQTEFGTYLRPSKRPFFLTNTVFLQEAESLQFVFNHKKPNKSVHFVKISRKQSRMMKGYSISQCFIKKADDGQSFIVWRIALNYDTFLNSNSLFIKRLPYQTLDISLNLVNGRITNLSDCNTFIQNFIFESMFAPVQQCLPLDVY